jgi:hypothetical protein
MDDHADTEAIIHLRVKCEAFERECHELKDKNHELEKDLRAARGNDFKDDVQIHRLEESLHEMEVKWRF